ncbi:Aste57867_17422 [Aphanomyces stellatus]|uniref:Aste57867_17422 protein n=1 Tax=Aphanomyces stellatus TaxID=120398 RepID=A0A485L9J6_9STRA|nr:hypothetical protein As57867_017362 [Aphanomyces stellatus]VFT94178.1 Aste57867_17422 [Aphanomyces stellatus]
MPVSADFFTCPPLSLAQIDYIKDVAAQVCREVVDHACVDASPIQWTLVANETYGQMYRGRDPTAPAGVVSYLAESTLHNATLDDMSTLFYASSTPAYKEYIKTYYDELRDGAKLYEVVAGRRHSVSVNWLMQETPTRGVVFKNRDWCFVESQDHVVMPDGRRAWVRSFRSIQLACCPNLQATLGYVRADHYRSGTCYIETDMPGVLTVRQLLQVQLNGDLGTNMSDYVVQRGFKTRVKAMAHRVDRGLLAHRLSRSSFVVYDSILMAPRRRHCRACDRAFGLLVRRRQCQKCAEVVCNADGCSAVWDVSIGGRLAPRRICTFCSGALIQDNARRASKDLIICDSVGRMRDTNTDTFDSDVSFSINHHVPRNTHRGSYVDGRSSDYNPRGSIYSDYNSSKRSSLQSSMRSSLALLDLDVNDEDGAVEEDLWTSSCPAEKLLSSREDHRLSLNDDEDDVRGAVRPDSVAA